MISKGSICKFLLDIVFPNRCPVCGKFIRWDKLICENCMEKLPIIDIPVCTVCGYDKCVEHNNLSYDRAFSVMFFQDEGRRLIYEFKHSGKVNNFAELSAKLIAEKLRAEGIDREIDIVTCVPMSADKRAARGYNQAEIFGKFLANELKKPWDFQILKRIKDKGEQHLLSADDRKLHAQRVYRLNKNFTNLSEKTVLLCDDVQTTGATFNACAGLLKQAGAKSVICTSIALTRLEGQENGE